MLTGYLGEISTRDDSRGLVVDSNLKVISQLFPHQFPQLCPKEAGNKHV